MALAVRLWRLGAMSWLLPHRSQGVHARTTSAREAPARSITYAQAWVQAKLGRYGTACAFDGVTSIQRSPLTLPSEEPLARRYARRLDRLSRLRSVRLLPSAAAEHQPEAQQTERHQENATGLRDGHVHMHVLKVTVGCSATAVVARGARIA